VSGTTGNHFTSHHPCQSCGSDGSAHRGWPFDRRMRMALRNAVSVATCSRVCRRFRLAKNLSQRKLGTQTINLACHLRFSYVAVSYAQQTGIASTEAQLTLCGQRPDLAPGVQTNASRMFTMTVYGRKKVTNRYHWVEGLPFRVRLVRAGLRVPVLMDCRPLR